jgi:hypothetical protein
MASRKLTVFRNIVASRQDYLKRKLSVLQAEARNTDPDAPAYQERSRQENTRLELLRVELELSTLHSISGLESGTSKKRVRRAVPDDSATPPTRNSLGFWADLPTPSRT